MNGNAPVTQNASERYAALKVVSDLLARTERALTAVGNPPGVEVRDVVLDLIAQTTGAVDEWIALERSRLS